MSGGGGRFSMPLRTRSVATDLAPAAVVVVAAAASPSGVPGAAAAAESAFGGDRTLRSTGSSWTGGPSASFADRGSLPSPFM